MQTLRRLIETVRGLRALDRVAPEILRARAARDAAVQEMQARKVREADQAMGQLAQGLEATLEELEVRREKTLEAQKQKLNAALDAVVQPDSQLVQQRAVNSVLNTWEEKLQGGGRSAPTAGPGGRPSERPPSAAEK